MVNGRHSLTQDRNSRSVIGGHIMVATVAVVVSCSSFIRYEGYARRLVAWKGNCADQGQKV